MNNPDEVLTIYSINTADNITNINAIGVTLYILHMLKQGSVESNAGKIKQIGRSIMCTLGP